MKNLKNIIEIQNNLITNFKPNFTQKIKKFNFFKKLDKNNEIYCRNFLIYIILIKNNKNLSFFLNTKLYIKKKKNKIYTILRSPYRHKLARHQISLNRYFIKIIFQIKIKNNLVFENFNKIFKIITLLKKINIIFETNIIFLENIKIFLIIDFRDNFILKNFNI